MSDTNATNKANALHVPSAEVYANLAKEMRTAWTRLHDGMRAAAEAIEQSHNTTHTI